MRNNMTPIALPAPTAVAKARWLHACRPWLAEPDRVALARLTDADAPPTATGARRLAEIAARVETRCTDGAQ